MKAKVITLSDNKESFEAADRLIDSSNHYKNQFTIDKYIATTSKNVVEEFKKHSVKWNYPWTEGHLDIQSGLYKTAYETADPKKRMACFMSHYRLWKQCAEEHEDYMIFEHDALFTRRLDLNELDIDGKFNIVSLNDPRGATRLSGVYHEMLQRDTNIVPCPYVDNNKQTPQGLPGNSAYYITPIGARTLIELVRHFGAWPNDAIMCNQMMPRMLGCLSRYATTIQKTTSTTTK
tara:strand:- start:1359 stop:2060 length:702 start_codon:yes stop_codon:yes gene_type:complete